MKRKIKKYYEVQVNRVITEVHKGELRQFINYRCVRVRVRACVLASKQTLKTFYEREEKKVLQLFAEGNVKTTTMFAL